MMILLIACSSLFIFMLKKFYRCGMFLNAGPLEENIGEDDLASDTTTNHPLVLAYLKAILAYWSYQFIRNAL